MASSVKMPSSPAVAAATVTGVADAGAAVVAAAAAGSVAGGAGGAAVAVGGDGGGGGEVVVVAMIGLDYGKSKGRNGGKGAGARMSGGW